MRVVVVGGGFGGMATAARLARLGHEVALLEAADRLGGAVGAQVQDGFRWATGPSTTLLPAVVRDLFRKTGRPLERELTLVPVEVLREHRFADGSVVRLPGGSRAAQLRAVDELGAGLGREWVAHVDGLAADWELLRRDYLERPWDAATGPRDLTERLRTRRTLQGRLRRELGDPRLRLLAAHPVTAQGQEPGRVPEWLAVWPYVEQVFGGWAVEGGLDRLTDALAARLELRGVQVRLRAPVADLVVTGGRVAGVRVGGEVQPADAVVCAVDPRTLPALASYVARTGPAPLPRVTHLGLAGETGLGSPELVVHGPDPIMVRAGLAGPLGHEAVTLLSRGHDDPVSVLAAGGIELRDRVVTRVEVSPQDQARRWAGSPYGVLWRGRSTLRHRLGPRTPIRGVYAAGAHATPGAGLPFVGLSAALVAQVIGPAH